MSHLTARKHYGMFNHICNYIMQPWVIMLLFPTNISQSHAPYYCIYYSELLLILGMPGNTTSTNERGALVGARA